jgi:hypothetical protein
MSLETEFLMLGWGLLGAFVVTALCSEREPGRHRRRGRNLLDVLAVTFAAFAFAASAWQGWVARDVEKRQLRAYIAVDPVGPKNFAPNVAPSAGVRITVRGQTPAYNVTLITSIATLPYPSNEDKRATETHSPLEITKTILAPEQWSENLPTLTYAPDPIQFGVIKASKQDRLYVWGEVHYTDAFDHPWQNRFCYSLNAADSNATTFEACPNGNCADVQCG